jgi:hypothetical protein
MPRLSLPSVISDIPQDLRAFLDRLREMVSGTGSDRLVFGQDLVNLGLADAHGGTLVPPAGPVTCHRPTAPTHLTANGAMTAIMLEWKGIAYPCHSHTQVWRASENDFGQAVMIGQSAGVLYVDAVGSRAKFYYWVRFVNTDDVEGPLNAANGTLGETAPDVEYLLDQLEGQITESQLYQDLQTRLDGIEEHEAALKVHADVDKYLGAQYSVRITNAGHVSGFGLSSTRTEDRGVESAFGVVANRFWIAPPVTATGLDPEASKTPFIVSTTPFLADDGVTTVPPGTYIRNAFIADAAITSAKIGKATIDSGHIIELTAGKITTGRVDVDETIASSNYVDGVQGWAITGKGDAAFNQVVVRGAVYADRGTFSGELKAATGTFTGALRAATGTFGGTWNGVTVTGPRVVASSAGIEIFNASGTRIFTSGGAAALQGQITNANVSTWIANASIDAAHIKSVNASTITTGTLDANLITTGTLNADLITAGTIRADRIVSESLRGGHGGQIQQGSIQDRDIASLSVSKLYATGAQIQTAVINQLAAGLASIDTAYIKMAHIDNLRVGTIHIVDGAVETDKIASGAVTAAAAGYAHVSTPLWEDSTISGSTALHCTGGIVVVIGSCAVAGHEGQGAFQVSAAAVTAPLAIVPGGATLMFTLSSSKGQIITASISGSISRVIEPSFGSRGVFTGGSILMMELRR